MILEKLKIVSIGAEGKSIAKSDGQVVFVPKCAPGDVIDARVTKKHKSYVEAVPVKFHSQSKSRVDPFCTHFELCGGCKWQHLTYKDQLKFKQQQVQDQFERIGNFDFINPLPIVPAVETQMYRNKLEYTATPWRWFTKAELDTGEMLEKRGFGFHAPGRFDRIIDINNCHLQKEPTNEIRNFTKQYCIDRGWTFYNRKKKSGFIRNLIIRICDSGEIMVVVQFGENDPGAIDELMQAMTARFPAITSLNYVVNSKGNDTFFDLDVVNVNGIAFITEIMEDLEFRIGPKSFFQTNTAQALRLYQIAMDFAEFSGQELVYDLYTGTGTIANYVARKCKKVVGIDSIPEAIDDAKINSSINGIENTEFFAGDVKDVITNEFLNEHGTPDVIITDPPRAGMHPSVIESILKIRAKKIVYVSCNPATQARDLSVLQSDYSIDKIQPVDMFPHTHHVENVVLLKRL